MAAKKSIIEKISTILENQGYETYCIFRDYEKWEKIKFSPQEIMRKTFKELANCDVLIVEFSEKGVGLGIEAGYAYAKKIPIVVLAKIGSEISSTLRGTAQKIIFYDNLKDINKLLKLNLLFNTLSQYNSFSAKPTS